jgi:Kelch motif
MGSHAPERLTARRQARARAIRRRRAGALIFALAFAGLLAWLLAPGASTRPGAGRAARARRAPTSVRVAVKAIGQLPVPLQDAASASDPGTGGVMLVGGLDAEEASLPDIRRIVGASVATVGAMPTPLHDACASELGGSVYVFGGGEQTSFSGIVRIAPAASTAQTESVGSLPTPASDVACATLGGTAYIVGGYTGQAPLRTILAWRPGAPPRLAAMLPKPLRYAAVGAVGNEILIAGGTSGADASRDVYSFEPGDGRVRTLTRLPVALTHAAGASLGGALLVIGGRGSSPGSQRSSILAVYPTGSVAVAGTLPRALSDLSAAPTRSGIVLAGGADAASSPVSEIMALTLGR